MEELLKCDRYDTESQCRIKESINEIYDNPDGRKWLAADINRLIHSGGINTEDLDEYEVSSASKVILYVALRNWVEYFAPTDQMRKEAMFLRYF